MVERLSHHRLLALRLTFFHPLLILLVLLVLHAHQWLSSLSSLLMLCLLCFFQLSPFITYSPLYGVVSSVLIVLTADRLSFDAGCHGDASQPAAFGGNHVITGHSFRSYDQQSLMRPSPPAPEEAARSVCHVEGGCVLRSQWNPWLGCRHRQCPASGGESSAETCELHGNRALIVTHSHAGCKSRSSNFPAKCFNNGEEVIGSTVPYFADLAVQARSSSLSEQLSGQCLMPVSMSFVTLTNDSSCDVAFGNGQTRKLDAAGKVNSLNVGIDDGCAGMSGEPTENIACDAVCIDGTAQTLDVSAEIISRKAVSDDDRHTKCLQWISDLRAGLRKMFLQVNLPDKADQPSYINGTPCGNKDRYTAHGNFDHDERLRQQFAEHELSNSESYFASINAASVLPDRPVNIVFYPSNTDCNIRNHPQPFSEAGVIRRSRSTGTVTLHPAIGTFKSLLHTASDSEFPPAKIQQQYSPDRSRSKSDHFMGKRQSRCRCNGYGSTHNSPTAVCGDISCQPYEAIVSIGESGVGVTKMGKCVTEGFFTVDNKVSNLSLDKRMAGDPCQGLCIAANSEEHLCCGSVICELRDGGLSLNMGLESENVVRQVCPDEPRQKNSSQHLFAGASLYSGWECCTDLDEDVGRSVSKWLHWPCRMSEPIFCGEELDRFMLPWKVMSKSSPSLSKPITNMWRYPIRMSHSDVALRSEMGVMRMHPLSHTNSCHSIPCQLCLHHSFSSSSIIASSSAGDMTWSGRAFTSDESEDIRCTSSPVESDSSSFLFRLNDKHDSAIINAPCAQFTMLERNGRWSELGEEGVNLSSWPWMFGPQVSNPGIDVMMTSLPPLSSVDHNVNNQMDDGSSDGQKSKNKGSKSALKSSDSKKDAKEKNGMSGKGFFSNFGRRQSASPSSTAVPVTAVNSQASGMKSKSSVLDSGTDGDQSAKTDGPGNASSSAGKAKNVKGDEEAVKSAGKPEAVKSAGKPEGVKSAGKPEAVKSAGKPEAVKSAGTPEAVKSSGKHEAVKSAGKPEAVKSAGKPETGTKNTALASKPESSALSVLVLDAVKNQVQDNTENGSKSRDAEKKKKKKKKKKRVKNSEQDDHSTGAENTVAGGSVSGSTDVTSSSVRHSRKKKKKKKKRKAAENAEKDVSGERADEQRQNGDRPETEDRNVESGLIGKSRSDAVDNSAPSDTTPSLHSEHAGMETGLQGVSKKNVHRKIATDLTEQSTKVLSANSDLVMSDQVTGIGDDGTTGQAGEVMSVGEMVVVSRRDGERFEGEPVEKLKVGKDAMLMENGARDEYVDGKLANINLAGDPVTGNHVNSKDATDQAPLKEVNKGVLMKHAEESHLTVPDADFDASSDEVRSASVLELSSTECTSTQDGESTDASQLATESMTSGVSAVERQSCHTSTSENDHLVYSLPYGMAREISMQMSANEQHPSFQKAPSFSCPVCMCQAKTDIDSGDAGSREDTRNEQKNVPSDGVVDPAGNELHEYSDSKSHGKASNAYPQNDKLESCVSSQSKPGLPNANIKIDDDQRLPDLHSDAHLSMKPASMSADGGRVFVANNAYDDQGSKGGHVVTDGNGVLLSRPSKEMLDYVISSLRVRKLRVECQKLALERENLRLDITLKRDHLQQEFGHDQWQRFLPPIPLETGLANCQATCRGSCCMKEANNTCHTTRMQTPPFNKNNISQNRKESDNSLRCLSITDAISRPFYTSLFTFPNKSTPARASGLLNTPESFRSALYGLFRTPAMVDIHRRQSSDQFLIAGPSCFLRPCTDAPPTFRSLQSLRRFTSSGQFFPNRSCSVDDVMLGRSRAYASNVFRSSASPQKSERGAKWISSDCQISKLHMKQEGGGQACHTDMKKCKVDRCRTDNASTVVAEQCDRHPLSVHVDRHDAVGGRQSGFNNPNLLSLPSCFVDELKSASLNATSRETGFPVIDSVGSVQPVKRQSQRKKGTLAPRADGPSVGSSMKRGPPNEANRPILKLSAMGNETSMSGVRQVGMHCWSDMPKKCGVSEFTNRFGWPEQVEESASRLSRLSGARSLSVNGLLHSNNDHSDGFRPVLLKTGHISCSNVEKKQAQSICETRVMSKKIADVELSGCAEIAQSRPDRSVTTKGTSIGFNIHDDAENARSDSRQRSIKELSVRTVCQLDVGMLTVSDVSGLQNIHRTPGTPRYHESHFSNSVSHSQFRSRIPIPTDFKFKTVYAVNCGHNLEALNLIAIDEREKFNPPTGSFDAAQQEIVKFAPERCSVRQHANCVIDRLPLTVDNRHRRSGPLRHRYLGPANKRSTGSHARRSEFRPLNSRIPVCTPDYRNKADTCRSAYNSGRCRGSAISKPRNYHTSCFLKSVAIGNFQSTVSSGGMGGV